ncbi:MAG: sugar transferase [Pseudomonadales bacterium]
MRISKQNHLKRLLQTQDVLIAMLSYSVSLVVAWFVGIASLGDTMGHLYLLPMVAILGILASIGHVPALHGQSFWKVLVFAVRYAAIVVVGVLAMAYFGKFDYVSRYTLGLTGALLVAGLLANRLLLRWWYFHARTETSDNFLKVLVIGSGERARRLMETYRSRSEWGIDFVGLLDPEAHRTGQCVDGAKVLGRLGDIRSVVSGQVIDEVIVCLPRSLIDNLDEVFDACAEEGICIKFLADLYDMPDGTISLEHVGNAAILNFDPVHHQEGKLIVKRIVDLLLTIPALLMLMPLFLLIAGLIKLDSRGPVFFVQPRVGLNKRIFGMIKFRSMFEDAESRLAELEHLNEAEGPIFKVKHDPRITRVGRWLRRSSIDELPQLFNVLAGHMSLVGPRPMSLRDVSRFSQGVQRRRFSVRPGLACLREISGRSRLSFDRWLELDLKYIDEWSLWLDFKILLRLVPSVIRGDGAS